MSEVDTAETLHGTATADIDLSDLISVSINSKQLQLTLSNVLRRLAKLEEEKKADDVERAAAKEEAAAEKAQAREDAAAAAEEGAAAAAAEEGAAAAAADDDAAEEAKDELKGSSKAADRGMAAPHDSNAAAANNDAISGAISDAAEKMKDLEERLNQCRRDLDDERNKGQSRDDTIAAHADKMDDLTDRVVALEGGLSDAKDEIAVNSKNIDRLDDIKADKVDHVDPLVAEIDWIKDELKNLNGANNGLQSRMTGLEGMQALANPDAAKDNGLTTFTDTLNNLLNKQKELEDKVDEAGRKDTAGDNSHDQDLEAVEARLAALEAQLKACEKDGDDRDKALTKFATQNDMEAAIKDVFEKVRRPASSPGGPQGPRDGLTVEEREMLQTYPATAAEVVELKDALAKMRANNDRPVDEGRELVSGDGDRSAVDVASAEDVASKAPSAASRGVDFNLGNKNFNSVTNNNNSNAGPAGVDHSEDIAALKARVKALEDGLTKLGDRVDSNSALLKDHGTSIGALGQECSRNADSCNKLQQQKADKGDLPKGGGGGAGAGAGAGTGSGGGGGTIAGANGVDGSSGASREAMLALAKDVGNLRDQLKKLQQQQSDAPKAASAVDTTARAGVVTLPAANTSNTDGPSAEDLQRRMDDLEDWAKGQVVDIRATVDHVHHNKADAASVANKAERDYVENAMEKLMHEVEHVLNATNAGLIDTLDKSLNILRDMIDGKATKGDVQKLQSVMAAGREGADGRGSGNVPDGLTGVTSYRCLGCNRTMDSMRPRPMGGTTGNFLNRVPNNTRTVQSSQGPRMPITNGGATTSGAMSVGASPSPPAGGYINAPPRSS